MPWWAIVLIVLNSVGLGILGSAIYLIIEKCRQITSVQGALQAEYDRRKMFWNGIAPGIHDKYLELSKRVRKLEETNAQEPMGRAPD